MTHLPIPLNISDIRIVFFDLDNTLLDHNSAERDALYDTVQYYPQIFSHVEFDEVAREYQLINDRLWAMLAHDEITIDELKIARFSETIDWANKHISSVESREVACGMSTFYLQAYSRHWRLFPEAEELVSFVKQHVPVGLITNGFSEQQRGKLAFLRWENMFDAVVVSGEVGASKPHKPIFEIALKMASEAVGRTFVHGEALYIGDNYRHDIIGAYSAGWQSLWLTNSPETHSPHVASRAVRSLREIIEIFQEAFQTQV